MAKEFRKFYRVSFLLLTLFICSGVTAQDYKTVKPKKNDGIYSLLRRNGLSPQVYEAEFIKLNKKSLGKNNALYADRSYKLPNKNTSTATAAKEPAKNTENNTVKEDSIKKPASNAVKEETKKTNNLFGSKYKDVTIKDNSLKGAVFYLVSGHGGPDPGAVAYHGKHMLCEDEYAYDVTLRLARRLMEHNATVYMIIQDKNDGIRDDSILAHDKDEVCYPNLTIPLNQKKRLEQRKDAINALNKKHKEKYQRAIFVHIDSRSKKENIDVFFYHKSGSAEGKRMAQSMHRTFGEKYKRHQPGRGYNGTISTRNLFVLNNTVPPAVFIELGNIQHQRDLQRFMIVNNRQAMANWLAESLIKDYNR